MNQDQINRLSLFFAKARIQGMAHLEEMLALDDLWKGVYEVYRHYSFRDAQLKANEAVIKSILEKP